MKVFLILSVCLSFVAALPTLDRQQSCHASWVGDGFCDDGCNTAANKFDGGDCCGSNVNTQWCSKCQCLQGGSGGGSGGSSTANQECAKIPSWIKSKLSFMRIVNGQTAQAPIPWQAHMRQGSPTGGFGFFCGGTILDAKTILTAAHCYHGKDLTATNYFIAAGATSVTDPSAQTAFVESITLHENYNPSNTNNDIAILKLKTALTFNDKVRPACLPAATLTPSGIAAASGWGLIGQEPDVRTFDLMYVTKPVIPNTQCTRPNFLWGTSQI